MSFFRRAIEENTKSSSVTFSALGIGGPRATGGLHRRESVLPKQPNLGRIFKTEFILQYLSEPELRRRIRRWLLKVEVLHAPARDAIYGRRGRIKGAARIDFLLD